jgi:hypothetical protein
VLAPGGAFVAKVLRGGAEADALLRTQLRVFFPDVAVVKPKSSRASSAEAFAVCKGFVPLAGFKPRGLPAAAAAEEGGGAGAGGSDRKSLEKISGELRVLVPYLASGDLSGWDSPSFLSL